MMKRIVLFTVLAILMWGFWISSEFKEIAAGVAIFLWGMLLLEKGFKAFTGGLLERILTRTTDRLWKSLSFGLVSTALMQSSSLVSVITISFLSAGLIELIAGVGIIFGANIGTTTGAWLIAAFGLKVKISAYAMPMLVFGIILVFQNNNTAKGIGYILAGLGFLFMGIHFMKEGFETFKDTIDLTQFAIPGYKGLFIFTGIGVFATVVMQSSHATLVLIITALAVGQITYENALALAIGANIGTTITAILGSLGSDISGKRLAAAHLIFNTVTGLIAISFIHQFLWMVEVISGHLSIANDDYTMKLAVFHTIFNIVGVVVMIPFMKKMVNFLEKAFRSKKKSVSTPYYLNEAVLELPDTAFSAILRETQHLFDNAAGVIAAGLHVELDDIYSDKDLKKVVATSKVNKNVDLGKLYHNKVKTLYGDIIAFTSRAQQVMDPEQIEFMYRIKVANRSIVNTIKKVQKIEGNIANSISSNNKYIKAEYDNMRLSVLQILRSIHHLRDNGKDEDIIETLNQSRRGFVEQDIVTNGTLDRLIRQEMVTNYFVGSLVNDNAEIQGICSQLLDIAGHYSSINLREIVRHNEAEAEM